MQKAFSVKEACEMILIRVTYAADLPDLKTLIDKSELKKKNELNISDKTRPLKSSEKSKTLDNYDTFDDLLAYIKKNKAISIYTILIDQVKIVDYKPYNIKK